MPHVRDMLKIQKKIVVLIHERIEVKRYFKVFRKHKYKPLFLGTMYANTALLAGRSLVYFYLRGTKYERQIYSAIMDVLTTAQLNRAEYAIHDWFSHKGMLMIHLVRVQTPRILNRPFEMG